MLACGEMLSMVLLEATVAGLATCTLTDLTELSASRHLVEELTGRAHPQVLVRVGQAPVDEQLSPTPKLLYTDRKHMSLKLTQPSQRIEPENPSSNAISPTASA
jgi:hypothetical protein